jgi:hypothetical protein
MIIQFILDEIKAKAESAIDHLSEILDVCDVDLSDVDIEDIINPKEDIEKTQKLTKKVKS